MATGLYTSSHDWQNEFTAHLSADLGSSDTDIFLDTIPTSTEGCLVIDPDTPASTEVIFYTSKTSSKVTVPSVGNGRGYDNSTATTHLSGTKVIMAPIADDFRYIRTLATANATYLAAGGGYDFVASGCVWTGDALGSTLNASMTSGTVYISGSPVTVAAITAHNFTASKDTYVDVSNTGTITYTAVANNAASPSLAASNVRLAIVVSGATNIAAAASINQGQETMVLPIASSIPYTVTDSLGNLICPRDPNRKIIGYRQITTNATTTTTSDMTGLNLTCIIPTGRKVKVSGYIGSGTASVINNGVGMVLVDVTAGANLVTASSSTNSSGDSVSVNPSAISSAGGTRNYKAQITKGTNAATANSNGTATNPNYIMVELV